MGKVQVTVGNLSERRSVGKSHCAIHTGKYHSHTGPLCGQVTLGRPGDKSHSHTGTLCGQLTLGHGQGTVSGEVTVWAMAGKSQWASEGRLVRTEMSVGSGGQVTVVSGQVYLAKCK